MKHVFIILLNFNNDNDTHKCLESIKRLSSKGVKISTVVVDNGSKNYFKFSTDEKEQSVYLIRLEQNQGFTGGNNTGIKFALQNGASHVLILNNDTILEKNLIKELLLGLEKNNNAGIIVPKIYFAKGHEFHKERYKESELGRVFWYAGGFLDWKNILGTHRGVDEVDIGQYENEEKVDFATGCCMLIPKNVIERVGMFGSDYFLYFEDIDLSIRVLKCGYDIWYMPKAILWHINAGSTGGSGSSLHDYFITRNRLLFGMKYAPIRSKIALLRESIRLLIIGRTWQKKGISDYYARNFGKGSYFKS